MRFQPFTFAVFFGIQLGIAPIIHAQSITPNENLVVEGVPPIPQELGKAVERYTQFRSASLSLKDE